MQFTASLVFVLQLYSVRSDTYDYDAVQMKINIHINYLFTYRIAGFPASDTLTGMAKHPNMLLGWNKGWGHEPWGYRLRMFPTSRIRLHLRHNERFSNWCIIPQAVQITSNPAPRTPLSILCGNLYPYNCFRFFSYPAICDTCILGSPTEDGMIINSIHKELYIILWCTSLVPQVYRLKSA